MPSANIAATAVVLCAGGSTRMGHPKGLIDLDGEPLLLAHVHAFQRAGLPVTVVLGCRAAEHQACLGAEVRVVLNPSWARTGLSDSAALALVDAGTVLLTPVDVPPARPETLAALLAAAGDAVPTHRGLDGHPVRLSPPHAASGRLDLRLAGARRVPVDDPDCLQNLNTPAAWEAWMAQRRG